MHFVSRRQAMKLASSLAAAFPLLKGSAGRAQVTPGSAATVFEMADFAKGAPDIDAAFAKALAAISKSAGEANKAGKPVPIVFNLEKNATYKIKQPLVFKQFSDFELNGNEARLVNITLASTLLISGSNRVTVRDLAIDYDPLPFTQGTITSFDHAALQIMVEVDPGYPDDAKFLASINDGFFKVMDRHTRALKPGARDFLTPSRIERVGDKMIKVHLQWSANDTFPSHCITGANALTDGSGALGTIYVGMVTPEGAKGFANSFQNRNITIQGNRIDNSFIYGIFVGNADGVRIIDNFIGQTFIRGSFDAGKFYGETPNSGIFIGRSRNAQISHNSVARGRIAKTAVAVDSSCVRESIHLANNLLT
jgi:hypothetical protein